MTYSEPREPRCSHVGSTGPDSVMVSSHKDITKAKGRMASARVCSRPACVLEAKVWVARMGPGKIFRNGVLQ